MLRRLIAKKIDQATVDALVALELRSIQEIASPVAVYLFGSAARAEMTDASDLDFLVVLDDRDDLKLIKKRYYERPKKHEWPVDIIFMKAQDFEEKSLVGGVAMICRTEAKVIFRRS